MMQRSGPRECQTWQTLHSQIPKEVKERGANENSILFSKESFLRRKPAKGETSEKREWLLCSPPLTEEDVAFIISRFKVQTITSKLQSHYLDYKYSPAHSECPFTACNAG